MHGEMINRITQGLKRKDITLASLIQVADAMVLKSGVRAGTAVEPNSEERGPNGCLMYNGEECNGERAGTCKERTCHCIGHWTGLRCQSGLYKLLPHFLVSSCLTIPLFYFIMVYASH